MHAPAVGSILRGLHRPSGLNAERKRSIIPRSSGVNSFGMKSIFGLITSLARHNLQFLIDKARSTIGRDAILAS
jgi:hypothetical protein